MLTRLKVSGFKNLIDVDVRFGAFTCIAGANGVGKSNLFDAILLLSALADRPFIEAIRFVRDSSGRGDLLSAFHRVGQNIDKTISLEAEMIVPRNGTDDLGQSAKAGITFLRYDLVLGLRKSNGSDGPGIELRKEQLTQINVGEAKEHLAFPHSPAWRRSVVQGRRVVPYISTENEDSAEQLTILLHQDGIAGLPLRRLAKILPRTVLSTINTAEHPTVLLARREMQSWKILQLEPTALRKPDDFNAPSRLGQDGSHLPATLNRLARLSSSEGNGANANDEPRVFSQVANRLAELIHDVRRVGIERDEKRELLTLQITDAAATLHPANVLSDGTLRFLALTILEMDPETHGMLCLEEPENGIHPERIPAMLRLLKDIALDPNDAIGPDNPLRQIIINTHSPSVVSQVEDADLLVADVREVLGAMEPCFSVAFYCVDGTWRDDIGVPTVARGKLLTYLNPVPAPSREPERLSFESKKPRAVRDRLDLFPLFDDEAALNVE